MRDRQAFRVPTLDSVLWEQGSLDELCGDRPLETKEICTFNAFYGQDAVLKTYADIPMDRPLKLAMTHGIQMNEEYVWDAEIAAPVPVMLVYPERLVAAYERRSRKATIRMAAPFLYAQRILEAELPSWRSGTLFFPSHSTHWVSPQVDADAIVRHLQNLPNEFHPVSVCVYWRDYLRGLHKPFEKAGFRIVSAGHMFDPAFLFRLCYLLAMHQYACSNTDGSHLFYAVKAGCSYFHIAELEYPKSVSLPKEDAPTPLEIMARLRREFAEQRMAPTTAQIRFVDEYVGTEHLLDPSKMREFLQFCERMDRYGTAKWNGQRFTGWPTILKRAFWVAPRRTAARFMPETVRAQLRRSIS